MGLHIHLTDAEFWTFDYVNRHMAGWRQRRLGNEAEVGRSAGLEFFDTIPAVCFGQVQGVIRCLYQRLRKIDFGAKNGGHAGTHRNAV